MDPRYGDGIAKGQARAAIVWPGADWRAMGLKAAIFAPRGRLAMAGLTALMDPGPDIAPGCIPWPWCIRRQALGKDPRSVLSS
jgi:UDP-3-O-[3-hydroxymyristoyl] glucosamine N-acyltransferase